MSKYIVVVLVLVSFWSCKKEVETPKVRYENTNKEKPVSVAKIDTSKIEVADLPIHFSGTNYLIHPIGDLNSYERDKSATYESRNESDQSFTVSNYNDYQITGFLQNIKFQEIGSDSIKALSPKPIFIETATYLKNLADKTKKQLMVYSLSDSDTNKDGKIDGDDIKALYISDISGTNFTKLSTDFQELIDWNVLEIKNRLYFREIEDSNKNGAFDKEDKVHYHYVDLLSKDLKVEEYNPIN